MKSIKHAGIFFILLIISILGCEDNTTKYYAPVFNDSVQNSEKDKKKEKTKAKVTVNKPVVKKQNPVIKENKFMQMLLTESAKWLEAMRAIQETTRRIYFNYFLDEGKYEDLASGQDLQTVYEKLGEKHLMPRLRAFEVTDITLSKIMPTDNRLIFTVIARGEGNQPKSGLLKFDISPERVRITLPAHIEQILLIGQTESNNDFDRYKWLEAENLLLGMQIGFMFFLFENKNTQFDNIRYPMKLSDLAQIIEFDEGIFKKLKYFSESDFKMQHFNCKSREFLFIAYSSGKFPAPKSGTKRVMRRAGWYYFKDKRPDPVVKNDENKNNGKHDEVEKDDTVKEDEEKPEVKKSLRLPSIKGKKVKLNLDFKLNVIRKKNVVYSKFVKKVPKKPYDFEKRLKKVLEDMGAKVVSSGYDAVVNVKMQINVDANTWMEEVINVKLLGTITVSSAFGDDKNSFDGSFNDRDNVMKRCFGRIWDAGVEKFEKMVNYAFEDE